MKAIWTKNNIEVTILIMDFQNKGRCLIEYIEPKFNVTMKKLVWFKQLQVI
jgi:hypothetical protein